MKSKMNIVCLPFAGGNKYSYRLLKEAAPSFLNIICLEYPGRGSRIREPLMDDTEVLMEDLYAQFCSVTTAGDYAIYGHSLGGLLGYLLTKRIVETGRKLPAHLFISGTTGPASTSRGERKRHLLSNPEFIQELKDLKGMPDEILENDDLLEYYEPILRADFKVSESYNHKCCAALDVPITVITGTEEDMEISDIELWQKETMHEVEFRRFGGNHFFIYEHTEAIIQIFKNKLFTNTKVYQL